MIRDDLRPSSFVVPQGLQARLKRLGGTNDFGEPLYRLCRAEDRYTKASGIWSLWNENLTLEERGGIDIPAVVRMLSNGMSGETIDEYIQGCMSAKPDSVVTGMMEIPVYPDGLTGWIVEFWQPATCARSEWEALSYCGGPLAGLYPEFGEYTLAAGPTPYLPSESQLETAVREHYHERSNKPASVRQRLINRLNRIEQKEAAKKKRIKEHLITLQKDGPLSLRNRLSLGAGRVMNELAKKAGLKSHVGN